MASPEVTIFPSGFRVCKQDKTFRSYQTFGTKPFFDLTVFNEETLAGKARVKREVDRGSVVVLPLVGDIECNSTRVSPGQVIVFSGEVEISNPYDVDLVNYLFVQVSAPLWTNGIKDFNIAVNRDALVSILPGVSIGKFAGRHNGTYKPDAGAKGVFVFVIEGAFEVQSRLLQPRDGLALTNMDAIDFEALSNEAMVIFFTT